MSEPRRRVRMAEPMRRQGVIPEASEAERLARIAGALDYQQRVEAAIATVQTGYEVDFYCAALRLVVEIDGAVHDDAERGERDARRTTILARRGVRVVRLENARLNRETLREAILPFTCPLSPQGEGDGG